LRTNSRGLLLVCSGLLSCAFCAGAVRAASAAETPVGAGAGELPAVLPADVAGFIQVRSTEHLSERLGEGLAALGTGLDADTVRLLVEQVLRLMYLDAYDRTRPLGAVFVADPEHPTKAHPVFLAAVTDYDEFLRTMPGPGGTVAAAGDLDRISRSAGSAVYAFAEGGFAFFSPKPRHVRILLASMRSRRPSLAEVIPADERGRLAEAPIAAYFSADYILSGLRARSAATSRKIAAEFERLGASEAASKAAQKVVEMYADLLGEARYGTGRIFFDADGLRIDARMTFDPGGKTSGRLAWLEAGRLDFISMLPEDCEYVVALKLNPELFKTIYEDYFEPMLDEATGDDAQYVKLIADLVADFAGVADGRMALGASLGTGGGRGTRFYAAIGVADREGALAFVERTLATDVFAKLLPRAGFRLFFRHLVVADDPLSARAVLIRPDLRREDPELEEKLVAFFRTTGTTAVYAVVDDWLCLSFGRDARGLSGFADAIRGGAGGLFEAQPHLAMWDERSGHKNMAALLSLAAPVRYATDSNLRENLEACIRRQEKVRTASRRYVARHGRLPTSMDDMLRDGLLEPADLYCPGHGGAYTYDWQHETTVCSMHGTIEAPVSLWSIVPRSSALSALSLAVSGNYVEFTFFVPAKELADLVGLLSAGYITPNLGFDAFQPEEE